MLPWLFPKLLEQIQILKNDEALPYYKKFLHLALPSYHRGFFGTLTCLTPKKKCTYIAHTISQVKMCCSRQFSHLQWNSCQLHTCQTSIQEKIWPLLPITIASLPATQNFNWDYTYTNVGLGYMSWPALLKEINEL